MGLYSSDIYYEKGTRTTICRRAQLKLSASSRWQDLSVTRLCHLKCFCQLKRLRLWAPPSVRTCARSWVFSHTAAESSCWTSSILWGRDIEEALQRIVSFQICTVTNKINAFKREYRTQKLNSITFEWFKSNNSWKISQIPLVFLTAALDTHPYPELSECMVQEELIEVLIDSEEVLQLPSSTRCQKHSVYKSHSLNCQNGTKSGD